MTAIKRIAFKTSYGVMDCLGCRARLSKIVGYPRRIRCPRCGVINLITETESGHIVVIDEKHIDRFDSSGRRKRESEKQGMQILQGPEWKETNP